MKSISRDDLKQMNETEHEDFVLIKCPAEGFLQPRTYPHIHQCSCGGTVLFGTGRGSYRQQRSENRCLLRELRM